MNRDGIDRNLLKRSRILVPDGEGVVVVDGSCGKRMSGIGGWLISPSGHLECWSFRLGLSRCDSKRMVRLWMKWGRSGVEARLRPLQASESGDGDPEGVLTATTENCLMQQPRIRFVIGDPERNTVYG